MRILKNSNLGPKYGVKLRQQYIKYYNMAHSKYQCVKCNYATLSISRISSGIWYCKKCKYQFVGYSYHPYEDL